MDPAEDLREAVEWYLQVIPPGRTSPPGPPSDRARVEAVIEQVDSAIAPFHLPAEIEWFWRNWRPEAFSPLPHPRLADPTSAQQLWEDVADPHFPKVLFPIAYESHGFLLVELGLPPEEPAPLWDYGYGDQAMVLTHPSLASLFRTVAMSVEAAGVSAPAHDEDRWATYCDLIDGPEIERLVERQLAASPQAGRERHVPVEDLRAWPPAWRRAQGVTDDAIRPLGATHTVREFAEAASVGPVVGRVAGRLRNRGGGSWGSYGELTDATGTILVFRSRSVLDVGGRSRDDEVEVELTATRPVVERDNLDSRPSIEAALADDQEAASARGADLARGMEDLATRLPVVRRIVPLG